MEIQYYKYKVSLLYIHVNKSVGVEKVYTILGRSWLVPLTCADAPDDALGASTYVPFERMTSFNFTRGGRMHFWVQRKLIVVLFNSQTSTMAVLHLRL